MVLRDDMMVVGDREREPLVQADAGSNGPPAKPRTRRRRSDESLSVGTIAVTMAAVIIVGFGFTAFLPSILKRDGVGSTATLTTPPAPVQPPPPVQPTQSEQFGATPPFRDPGLAQLPAPVPSDLDLHPESYKAWSLTNLAPALRTGIVPSEKQAGGGATGGALVPGAGKAAGRTALTAAEKAAVDRGLQELETKAAINAPARPTSTRFALTDEEKAAVERGLRELEKAAGQATP
jgi:hypothetical protein